MPGIVSVFIFKQRQWIWLCNCFYIYFSLQFSIFFWINRPWYCLDVLRKTKKFYDRNPIITLFLKLSDTVAWLSVPTGIYHLKVNVGTENTKNDAYVCQKEADQAGDRATRGMWKFVTFHKCHEYFDFRIKWLNNGIFLVQMLELS